MNQEYVDTHVGIKVAQKDKLRTAELLCFILCG